MGVDFLNGWYNLLALLWAPLMFSPILLMRKLSLREFYKSPKVKESVVEPYESSLAPHAMFSIVSHRLS